MVEDQILELVEDLVSGWNLKTRDFSRYRLDFSWPSIGTVDMLLHQYLGQKTLPEQAQQLLLQCAAYIGGIAYDYWKSFPDSPDVSLQLDTSGPVPEVILSASKGAHLAPGERFEIRVRAALEQLLLKPKRNMPIFADGMRRYIPEDRLVCSFAAGVCSGMSPYGEGVWKEKSLQEFAPQLEAVSKKMSLSSASYYRTSFPLIADLSSELLYFPHLCLPPAGFDEPFLGVRGASGIIDFLHHRSLEKEDGLALSLALASSCEELAALSGLVAAIALSENTASSELLTVSKQRRLSMPALRKSVEILRQMISPQNFWTERLLQGEVELAYAMFKFERSLGMLPLAFGTTKELFEQLATRDIYPFICSNDLRSSIEICELHLSTISSNIRIQFQLIYLYLTQGELDKASQLLLSCTAKDSLAQPEQALALELQGSLAERLGNKEECESLYLQAAKFSESQTTKGRLFLWLAKHKASSGDVESWKEFSDLAQHHEPYSPEIALQCYLSSLESETEEPNQETLSSLLRKYPNDRKIFFQFLSA